MEGYALEEIMLRLREHWPLFVKDLLELVLLVAQLLASWVAHHSHDSIIYLALFVEISLASVRSFIINVLPTVVVIAPGGSDRVLAPLGWPIVASCRVVQRPSWGGCGQATVHLSDAETIVEAVDDVIIRDVGDGGAGVEESLRVRP